MMARIVLATCLLLRLSSVAAQVPRGFARPAAASGGAQPAAPEAGVTNAKLGMAGLQQLAKDPASIQKVMASLMEDPDAVAEAKKMMQDPSFQREMEKIAGPMKQAMRQFAGAQGAQAGAQNAQLGMAALSRAMQDPSNLAAALKAMEDPATVAEVRKMLANPSFAAMMGQQVGSAKELLKGLGGDQNEALASRMRGLADWMNKQDEQQQLRDMLN